MLGILWMFSRQDRRIRIYIQRTSLSLKKREPPRIAVVHLLSVRCRLGGLRMRLEICTIFPFWEELIIQDDTFLYLRPIPCDIIPISTLSPRFLWNLKLETVFTIVSFIADQEISINRRNYLSSIQLKDARAHVVFFLFFSFVMTSFL